MPSGKGTLLDDCCFKEMREGEGGVDLMNFSIIR